MKEQYYEFPSDVFISKYVMDGDGMVYKLRVGKDPKQITLNTNGFRILNDFNVVLYLTYDYCRGLVDRIKGLFSNRVRLLQPLDNYELRRDGVIAPYKFPNNFLTPMTHGTYELFSSIDGSRIHVRVIDLICRYIIFSNVSKDFNIGFTVTNIKYGEQLTINSRDKNARYPSKQNTCYCVDVLKTRDVRIVVGVPEHVVDFNDGLVFHGPSGKQLDFTIKHLVERNRKVYILNDYDFIKRTTIVKYFYLEFDENQDVIATFLIKGKHGLIPA